MHGCSWKYCINATPAQAHAALCAALHCWDGDAHHPAARAPPGAMVPSHARCVRRSWHRVVVPRAGLWRAAAVWGGDVAACWATRRQHQINRAPTLVRRGPAWRAGFPDHRNMRQQAAARCHWKTWLLLLVWLGVCVCCDKLGCVCADGDDEWSPPSLEPCSERPARGHARHAGQRQAHVAMVGTCTLCVVRAGL